MHVLVLNGPNLNMLGIREPGKYGTISYNNLKDLINNHANEIGIEVTCKQSNSEGELIDIIQRAYFDKLDGIVFNPGGYTHTSVALLDALKSVMIPTVEVHITNIDEREEFRKFSYISLYAEKVIKGHGIAGYTEAMDYLKEKYDASPAANVEK